MSGNPKSRTVMDLILALSQGNPGATWAVSQLINHCGVDRASGLLLNLEYFQVVGPKIHLAFKRKCEEDPARFEQWILMLPDDSSFAEWGY